MKILKSIERTAKKIFLRFAKSLIKSEPVDIFTINPALIKQVLIVHLDRKVGNLILSTSMIELARNVFKNANIDILVSSTVKVLIDDNPHLKNIYEFNHSKFIKNPFKIFGLKNLLNRNKYEIAIESSNPTGTSSLNGFITYLSGAKYRVGFEGGSSNLFTNIRVTPNKSDHYYIAKQNLIKIFSKDADYLMPKLFVNNLEQKKIRIELNSNFNIDENKNFAGIWIGAHDIKKWDIKNFISIYNSILSHTSLIPILLFGVDEKNDFNNVKKNEFNTLLITELNGLKNIISNCSIFISGDTGPLHLAYALGIKTIGIFLQDNYDTYGYSVEGSNFIIFPKETHKMINEVVEICKKLESTN